MTAAEILDLPVQSDNRLIYATDVGQFYAVLKGDAGADAIVVGGFPRATASIIPVEETVVNVPVGKDFSVRLNPAEVIYRLDIDFPATPFDGQTVMLIIVGYDCYTRLYYGGMADEAYTEEILYAGESYAYQYFATAESWFLL